MNEEETEKKKIEPLRKVAAKIESDSAPQMVQHQAEAPLTQAAPVQNTYYTILAATPNCRLISVNVSVATTGEDLQVRVTVDGIAYVSPAVTVGAGADFMLVNAPSITALQKFTLMAAATGYVAYIDEGRSIKVEVQKTTANGAGTITGRVRYSKIP